MLKLLTRLLPPVEAVYDRAKVTAKRRLDLWQHLRIRPYLGYGTADELHLMVRVLDDPPIEAEAGQSVWKNVRQSLQRIESDEVPGARVRLTYGATTLDAVGDGDGYVRFQYPPPAPPERPWHRVRLDLLDPKPERPAQARTDARMLVPPPEARFAVISDLDDTVVVTGATNKLKHARSVLLNSDLTRLPFPGVAALYRALQSGTGEQEWNPIFYVSSSPWNAFGQFHAFMRHRRIPEGPIFLKDFGIDPGKLFKRGHGEHKLGWIRRLRRAYPDLPFLLIGDSGQHDPEIYRDAVAEAPGRFVGVLLRDVAQGEARDREVHGLCAEIRALGVPARPVPHTGDAAGLCADWGLIPSRAVADVRAEEAEEMRRDRRWWERVLR